MKARINEGSSLEQVAASVCDTLSQQGVSVVLSGGAVVSIYSENRFQSYDLDFVSVGFSAKVDGLMRELGFTKDFRHWVHPHSKFWAAFPPGPVAVGDETVREFAHRESAEGILRLLPPTECVMDRLVGVIHGNDPQCLDQAVAVARLHDIDLERIERWAGGEGPRGPHGFRAFVESLEKS